MRTRISTGSYRSPSRSIRATGPHSSGLEVVCWVAAMGFCLTALIWRLGYADSLGQVLAISGWKISDGH